MPGLEVKWRGGIAYAAGSVAGQRVRKSLGTRDPAQAEELRAQYEARLWKRHSYGEEAVRTFGEAATAYLEAGGDPAFLPPLVALFRTRVLGSIKPGEIQQAGRSLYPGRKPATWNRQAIVPARAVINHAAGLGWCAPIKVKQFAVEKVRRQAADRAWLDAFLAQADADGLPGLAAAVMFMWQTGARISEAARVMPAHVDLKERIVWLEQTKTGEWQAAHITRKMVIRIANLAKEDGEPLFGYASRFGIDRRMRAVCRRATLEWRSPHEAGRHSYATNALKHGATPRQVMEGGRWKTARMVLEIYAHAESGGRDIADMMDGPAGSNRAQRRRRQGEK